MGVRSDPSRWVVFAAPSSVPRVSGQIASHVTAVFLFQISTENLQATDALSQCWEKLVPGVLQKERKGSKPNRTLSSL